MSADRAAASTRCLSQPRSVCSTRPISLRPARLIAAFGNSDGDLQMLQWTTAGGGARLGVIVHHTDGEREVAYDRQSSIGRLDKALDEARQRHWTVVDMKRDWKVVFPER